MSHHFEHIPKAQRISDVLYSAYGSGTGYLFGIPPQHRPQISTIIALAIAQLCIKNEIVLKPDQED